MEEVPIEVMQYLVEMGLTLGDTLALALTCKGIHHKLFGDPYFVDVLRAKQGYPTCMTGQAWRAARIAKSATIEANKDPENVVYPSRKEVHDLVLAFVSGEPQDPDSTEHAAWKKAVPVAEFPPVLPGQVGNAGLFFGLANAVAKHASQRAFYLLSPFISHIITLGCSYSIFFGRLVAHARHDLLLPVPPCATPLLTTSLERITTQIPIPNLDTLHAFQTNTPIPWSPQSLAFQLSSAVELNQPPLVASLLAISAQTALPIDRVVYHCCRVAIVRGYHLVLANLLEGTNVSPELDRPIGITFYHEAPESLLACATSTRSLECLNLLLHQTTPPPSLEHVAMCAQSVLDGMMATSWEMDGTAGDDQFSLEVNPYCHPAYIDVLELLLGGSFDLEAPRPWPLDAEPDPWANPGGCAWKEDLDNGDMLLVAAANGRRLAFEALLDHPNVDDTNLLWAFRLASEQGHHHITGLAATVTSWAGEPGGKVLAKMLINLAGIEHGYPSYSLMHELSLSPGEEFTALAIAPITDANRDQMKAMAYGWLADESDLSPDAVATGLCEALAHNPEDPLVVDALFSCLIRTFAQAPPLAPDLEAEIIQAAILGVHPHVLPAFLTAIQDHNPQWVLKQQVWERILTALDTLAVRPDLVACVVQTITTHANFIPPPFAAQLLRRGFGLDLLRRDDAPSLHIDAMDVLLPLVEQGSTADVDAVLSLTSLSLTASESLIYRTAARSGNLGVVERCLADPNLDPAVMDSIALAMAASRGHTSVVACLLDDGRVDVDCVSERALVWAVAGGHIDVANLLLDASSHGRTPFTPPRITFLRDSLADPILALFLGSNDDDGAVEWMFDLWHLQSLVPSPPSSSSSSPSSSSFTRLLALHLSTRPTSIPDALLPLILPQPH